MKKLQGPALPVKAIGAPIVHGEAEAAPFIERWLTMQRTHLGDALASCPTRAEVLLALSMLTAKEARGPVLTLSQHVGREGLLGVALPIATGADGLSLFANSLVKPGEGRSFRVAFRITSNYMNAVVQIDTAKRRLTEPETSARYERNRRLVRSGFAQTTFMEDEVIADPDTCAVKVFDVFGINVNPMVRP